MNLPHKWLKKYFVPHEKNSYKPHFLRHESFLFFSLLIIILEIGFLAQVFLVFDKTNFLAAVLPGVLESMTNKERTANNVGLLSTNELLEKAAQMKAEDMATRGYFAHNSPDGKTPWYWLEQVGYKYTYAGENLAVNFFESEDVSEAWMNSPTHRANIVKKDYTEIGIGVAKGIYQGKHTIFVAQFFGTPAVAVVPTTKTETTIQPKSKPSPAVNPRVVASTPSETKTSTVEVLGEETTVNKKVIEKTTENLVKESQNESGVKSYVEKILTSPRHSINYLYAIIALMAIITLLLIAFIKSEMRHPVVILRGIGLIAIMLILSFINIRALDLDPQIPNSSGMGANVIEVFFP